MLLLNSLIVILLKKLIQMLNSFANCWTVMIVMKIVMKQLWKFKCYNALAICWKVLKDCWNIPKVLKAIGNCPKTIAKWCISYIYIYNLFYFLNIHMPSLYNSWLLFDKNILYTSDKMWYDKSASRGHMFAIKRFLS